MFIDWYIYIPFICLFHIDWHVIVLRFRFIEIVLAITNKLISLNKNHCRTWVLVKRVIMKWPIYTQPKYQAMHSL